MAKATIEKTDSSSLDKLVDIINSEFGQNTIFKPIDNMPVYKVHRISTGNPKLDKDLGGGLPTGRIHLISGPFSSGKSYLSNKIAAQFNAIGERVAIVEPEHTFDPDWAKKCGMDMDLVYVTRGKNAEQDVDLIELLVASGEFGLIVIDSLAAMIPKDIKDDPSDKAHMGKEAKLNNKMFKKVLSHQNELKMLGKKVPTIIAINQIREKIGVMFGSPETLPGGRMQQYAASVWIDFRAKETIQDANDDMVGMYCQYTVKKNKTAPRCKPGLVSMFVADYMGMAAGDWDRFGAIIDVATDAGLIEKSGKFYENKSGTLLQKKYMYKQLWSELQSDQNFHDDMVAAIKVALPDIELEYN